LLESARHRVGGIARAPAGESRQSLQRRGTNRARIYRRAVRHSAGLRRDLLSGSECFSAGGERGREEQHAGLEVSSDQYQIAGGTESNMTAVITKEKRAAKRTTSKKKGATKKTRPKQ